MISISISKNRWFFKFYFSSILMREYEAFVALGIK